VSDHRLIALAALIGVGLAFLGGVRLAFSRPPGRHSYRASRVSGAVLLAEVIAIAASPVPRGRMLVASALLAVALSLFLWAAWTNRARRLHLAFAAHAPEHLQTSGPYRLVRHPFYASYILTFVGGAIAAGTAWLAPVVLTGALTYWRAALQEEAAFEASPLREAYRSYARRVGMFLPRPPLPDRPGARR
jgi:protein-S-isoprenylcysteine O-methyltransferase Ste14